MNSILAALVNGTLVGAGLAFAVWVALRMAPGSLLNAATRYVVWWIVLVVAVAMPLLYLPVGDVARPMTRTVSRSARIQAVEVPHAVPAVAPGPSATSLPASLPSPRRAVFPITLSGGQWPGRIVVFWLATSALMLFRLLASMVTLERRKARAWAAPAELAASCSGSGRRIRVAISREISVPLVAGPWRSAILFPARLLDELSERELEQIGIHEAAHLARRDDYALLVQRAIEAVFALHPVVRWISNRIDLEREIACDDFVVAATGDSQPYAACLARVVELSGGVRVFRVAAAAAEDRSHLARRVEMLLDNTRHGGTRLLGLRLAAATLGIVALTWGAARTPDLLVFARAAGDVTRMAATPAPPRPLLVAQAAPPVRPPAVPATAQPSTSPAPMVFVPVVVLDPLDRFVTGLGKEVFRVQEDGVDQVVAQLNPEGEATEIFIVVDPQVGTALGTIDRIYATFQVTNTQVFGATGQGSLLDGVQQMAQRAGREPDHRKAVLVLTSSQANTRSYTQTELRTALAGLAIPVYTVELIDAAGVAVAGPGAASPRPILTELALQTGGRYVAVSQPDELPNTVSKILIEMRNMYFVGYVPSNTARDGGYRSLQVTLNAPRGLPVLTAHSRTGYVAPGR